MCGDASACTLACPRPTIAVRSIIRMVCCAGTWMLPEFNLDVACDSIYPNVGLHEARDEQAHIVRTRRNMLALRIRRKEARWRLSS
jgi:hypothetical protein